MVTASPLESLIIRMQNLVFADSTERIPLQSLGETMDTSQGTDHADQ